ncbi:hypothetical protein ACE193_23390 [Bernardetia sp. OM2101]|uniref:hypothetical protein n=1 Tax=Bernardetia sp. OM2101 TaxID=3344876 RepID=UPI0035CEC249
MKYYQKIDKQQIKLISLNCLLAEKEQQPETKKINPKKTTKVKLAVSSKYKTENFYTKPYHKHISSCINNIPINTDLSPNF